MPNSLYRSKKSRIIANLLILALAFLLAINMYELLKHIAACKEDTHLIALQIIALFVILLLAVMLRSSEIKSLKELDAQKEQLHKKTIDNISEKLADEEKLLKEYKDAIDKSAIVSKSDKNGIITYVNKTFCQATGYTEEELIGNTYKPIRHPENDREFFRRMWLTLLSKKTWKGKIKNRKKDGSILIVEATITPILDTDDEIKEFIAIMFDITKEYMLEEELRANEMKKQQKEYKEALTKTKESFLLVFTHELKTPLNAIINFSSFVKKRLEKKEVPDKERLIELLESVKQNGEDMLFLVTNILDTAKLLNKKMVFAKAAFELSELVDEIIKKIVPPEFKVETELQSNINIQSDRLRVGQIISNIISNAVKYGGGEIYISLKYFDNIFELQIEDNGYGIKNSDSIFELFWSDGNDTKRASKGTGIGLYYAKTLCDALGLTIEIRKPQKLKGACFCLTGKTT